MGTASRVRAAAAWRIEIRFRCRCLVSDASAKRHRTTLRRSVANQIRTSPGNEEVKATMKILYCHGLDGSPNGPKPTALRDAGHEVVSPSLPRDDFAAAVSIARRALETDRFDVLVGSSRGG